jgi:phosphatidylinositol glycan class A protein
VIDYLIYCFLEIMYPRHKIDVCKPWPVVARKERVTGEADEREVERYGTVRQKSPRTGRREDVSGLGL